MATRQLPVAACGRGDLEAADAMLDARSALSEEIRAEHYGALYQAAERNDTKALETMLSCGFAPNQGDAEIGKTALHSAAMEVWPDAVRVHGASVTVRDPEFHAQPLVWAAEGSTGARGDGRDHAAVARLLLDAGSPWIGRWGTSRPKASSRSWPSGAAVAPEPPA